MRNKYRLCLGIAIIWLSALIVSLYPAVPAWAAGATSNIHIVKYAADNYTIVSEKTVSYQWMQQMLPVYGDGKTHYFHQGPVFEGDKWNPSETVNLKDKGAVKGSSVKDLCELVGGAAPGDEVSLVAVDGWHTELAYSNVYTPNVRQGEITLCWYNGEDPFDGEGYGAGYPGNNAFHSALQIVFMVRDANLAGKHVFGNSDMKESFPEEKYQHFYDGQYPSTNGLSGKWIAEIRIYSGGILPGATIDYSVDNYGSAKEDAPAGSTSGITPPASITWAAILLGVLGILALALAVLIIINLRRMNLKIGGVLCLGIVLIAGSILTGLHPWEHEVTPGGQTAETSSQWRLSLVGTDGQLKNLSMVEIEDLPTYTGRGGFFTTVGVVNGPFTAVGVTLSDLCNLVGGLSQEDAVMISATDGYSTVFSYDQVQGKFNTYDTKTIKEVPHGELKVVLMYRIDGQTLTQDGGKPLRVAIVGADGLLTEGNNWVRWVNKIEVLKMQSQKR